MWISILVGLAQGEEDLAVGSAPTDTGRAAVLWSEKGRKNVNANVSGIERGNVKENGKEKGSEREWDGGLLLLEEGKCEFIKQVYNTYFTNYVMKIQILLIIAKKTNFN